MQGRQMFRLAYQHLGCQASQYLSQLHAKHCWSEWPSIGLATQHNFHRTLPCADWTSLCHFDRHRESDSVCCNLWTVSMKESLHSRCRSHISNFAASFTVGKSWRFADLRCRKLRLSKWHNLYVHTCSVCKEWGDLLPCTPPSTCKEGTSKAFVGCQSASPSGTKPLSQLICYRCNQSLDTIQQMSRPVFNFT